MKKVYIIQTSLVSQVELNALFAELVPDAKVHNLVDDSLLYDVMQNGGITPRSRPRTAFSQRCNSVGPSGTNRKLDSVGE